MVLSMIWNMKNINEIFEKKISLPFRTVNGIFLSLPFEEYGDTTKLLSPFQARCIQEIREGKRPREIIEAFFEEHPKYWDTNSQQKLLLTMVQLIKRQLAIIRAIEQQVTTKELQNEGSSPIELLTGEIKAKEIEAKARETLLVSQLHFSIHPEDSFHYSSLLEEVSDRVVQQFDNAELAGSEESLWQLGATNAGDDDANMLQTQYEALINHTVSHLLPVIGKVQVDLEKRWLEPFQNSVTLHPQLTAGISYDLSSPDSEHSLLKKVIQLAKLRTWELYQTELQELRQLFTFRGIQEKLQNIQNKIDTTYQRIDSGQESTQDIVGILKELLQVKEQVKKEERSAYIDQIESLITNMRSFGNNALPIDLHVSHKKIHHLLKDHLGNKEIRELLSKPAPTGVLPEHDPISMQCRLLANSSFSLRSVIVDGVEDVPKWLETCYFFRLAGFNDKALPFDLIPKISSMESVEDCIKNLSKLLEEPLYAEHLKSRSHKQWLFFDWKSLFEKHGLLPSLWKAYQIERQLAPLAKRQGVYLACFDGAKSPLLQNQTKPYPFLRAYARARDHSNCAIQLNSRALYHRFHTESSGKRWTESLLAATWKQTLFPDELSEPPVEDEKFIKEIAEDIEQKYLALLSDQHFQSFAENNGLKLSEVFDEMQWYISSFYGLGSALKKLEERANIKELKALFQHSPLFRLFLRECSSAIDQSLALISLPEKSNKELQKIWNQIHEEFLLTRDHIRLICEGKPFAIDDPLSKRLAILKDNLFLPVLLIKTYLKEKEEKGDLDPSWKKINSKAWTVHL